MPKNYSKPTSNKILDRMKMNPLLTWVSDMTRAMSSDAIVVPTQYRESVLATKKMLENDVSGFVNTVLDFAVDIALVDFKVETKNKNLTETLNRWLSNLNDELRGDIPVGVKALAKEYFKERWKGSSFLLLRTFWDKKDSLNLPNILYFVDGEDIMVDNKDKNRSLNGKTYRLRINKDTSIPLGNKKDEKIFIQRPYESWGVETTVPFLIRRGIFKNLKFLELLEKKGEFVVGKALEYIALLKKGDKDLTLSNNPDFIYSQADLEKTSSDFSKFLSNRNIGKGASVYTTNFDTELEHSIPDYIRALHQDLYTPIERRILAGLGLIDVVQGIASTRKEATLNPRPFFAEVSAGIEEFKALLIDVMSTISDENKSLHRKYFRNEIKIQSTIVTEGLNDKILTQFRSGYDRGIVSKQTYSEILGMDFDIEVERRKAEKILEDILYPPVTQNLEQNDDDIPEDKKGVEKKNFNKAKKTKNK